MSKKILKFGDIEIVKHEFHYSKSPISIRNIGVDKLTISDKFVSHKKYFQYFIAYKMKLLHCCILCLQKLLDM